MNYYIFDWDYDNLDVIGHYPQIEYDKGNNFNSPNNIRKVNPHEFPNFIPEINLKFHNKSKITNFIESPNTKAIYMDENFKEILVNFNLPKFKFHPLNVKFKSETLHYFWFQFLREDSASPQLKTLRIKIVRFFYLQSYFTRISTLYFYYTLSIRKTKNSLIFNILTGIYKQLYLK